MLCPQINEDDLKGYLDPTLDQPTTTDLPKDLKDYIDANNLTVDTSLDLIVIHSDIDYDLSFDVPKKDYTLVVDGETYTAKRLKTLLDKLNVK